VGGTSGGWTSGGALPANSYARLIHNGTTLAAVVNVGAGTFKIATSSTGASWTVEPSASGLIPDSVPPGNTVYSITGINTPTTITLAGMGGSTAAALVAKNANNLGTLWTSSAVSLLTYISSNGTGNVNNSPRFLAINRVSAGGTLDYLYGNDGVSWTTGSFFAGSAYTFMHPVYCLNCWLVIPHGVAKCWTSTDLVSWTEHVLPGIITATGALSTNYAADTNGQDYRTVIPQGTSSTTAILITTDGS
jgi:hypothetical protein